MATLRTDYVNDILAAAMDGKRQYRMIQNANGTVSFEDVTVYDQNGDTFSAGDVNGIDAQINTNTGNIATNASNISSLGTRMTTDERNISTNTDNIATNADNIATNTQNISKLNTNKCNYKEVTYTGYTISAAAVKELYDNNEFSGAGVYLLVSNHGIRNGTTYIALYIPAYERTLFVFNTSDTTYGQYITVFSSLNQSTPNTYYIPSH